MHDVADMLIADAQNLADFGAVVARLRERAELVGGGGQGLCDFSSWQSRVHVVAYASESQTVLNSFGLPAVLHPIRDKRDYHVSRSSGHPQRTSRYELGDNEREEFCWP
jgi:hypothetical protein